MAAARWFVDESALGLGKLLARVRDDVVYAGHPEVSDVPLGTLDVTWMPLVAERGWVVFRRDRRIHARPAEVRVFAEVGLRTVWLGGKRDMASAAQLELVVRHWTTIERKRGGTRSWSVEPHVARRRAGRSSLATRCLIIGESWWTDVRSEINCCAVETISI